MVYTDNMTRKARMKMEGNIPGSAGWALKKNDGMYPERGITRNTLKFTKKAVVSKEPDYHQQALNNGWCFHPETQTWTHPSYNNNQYSSIYQTLNSENLWEDKKPVPYHNNDDELGLAYNYTINCSGQSMKIFPNKWISEEFDTRHGRRRELWRYKKEMREKYALQFQAYKEEQREKERENNEYDEYQREFTIER
tara:strand:+ start:1181 stop:1765 length:585 start_codon:yes stop_codon:yes gene_type:complete